MASAAPALICSTPNPSKHPRLPTNNDSRTKLQIRVTDTVFRKFLCLLPKQPFYSKFSLRASVVMHISVVQNGVATARKSRDLLSATPPVNPLVFCCLPKNCCKNLPTLAKIIPVAFATHCSRDLALLYCGSLNLFPLNRLPLHAERANE